MLFNKPIHELTFKDIVAFCERQLPENKQLDYKYMLPKNHEKFAKTIASFANALGGTIIVGVQDDKNDKPCPPYNGIAYHEKIRNSIEDIIQTYIDPVVFVDINICVSPDKERMFIVVNIPQSNLTPHLVGKLKRAYIRTGQSSRPEAIVHPEKLPWLLDHRQKSERLRHILQDKAESHFDNYLKTLTADVVKESICTMSIVPLYPEEPLAAYKCLPELIRQSSAKASYGVMANPHYPLIPVQDGATIISNTRNLYKMTEFNAYGLLMNKQVVSCAETVNGHSSKTIHVETLAQNLTLFLVTARKFLEKLPCAGTFELRFKLNNIRAVRALLAKQQATVMEDYLRMDRSLTLSELQNSLPALLQNMMHEIAWSLGLIVPEEELQHLVHYCLAEVQP